MKGRRRKVTGIHPAPVPDPPGFGLWVHEDDPAVRFAPTAPTERRTRHDGDRNPALVK